MRALALLLVATGIAHAGWAPKERGELVGTRAPELVGLRWLQGGPLAMEKLRGKVVLVRFWTDGCRFCSSTAPSLRELDARHRERGLVVIGVHHPKEKGSNPEKAMRELGFEFPVATDRDWTTVKGWGVGTT